MAKPKIMQNKTSSDIPKTPWQKKAWIRARQLTAKKSGSMSEKKQPWGLDTKIFEDEKKNHNLIKLSDIAKAKTEKAVQHYRRPDEK